MGHIDSKELAFFSILKGLISPNIKDETLDIEISLEDLEEKMEIDKKIISSFIEELRRDGLLDILKLEGSHATLHFEKTDEKLLSLISIGELESTLKDMNRFVLKNLPLFNFTTNPHMKGIALRVNEILDKNPDADINHIIRESLSTYFSRPEANVEIAKILYRACENADEEDTRTLESILYFFLMLPPEENPFLTTILLTGISLEMEWMKNS